MDGVFSIYVDLFNLVVYVFGIARGYVAGASLAHEEVVGMSLSALVSLSDGYQRPHGLGVAPGGLPGLGIAKELLYFLPLNVGGPLEGAVGLQ